MLSHIIGRECDGRNPGMESTHLLTNASRGDVCRVAGDVDGAPALWSRGHGVNIT